jgi:hypothetical protein
MRLAHPAAVLAAGLLALATLGLSSRPAFADAIDGDWCAPEGGKSLSIAGSTIRTPGGKEIKGIYGRHDFQYVARRAIPSRVPPSTCG